ncbi:hypothetical protein HED55_25270 [Ochrobactrum haematophilum]|uniref:Uncharacterized protein n=1 Tax=Brucella haematophila TaxID=419474 RepID=A0ABX1DQR6_9HYPH|nr:hypothetical protein [Brucella haematophila]
MICDINDILVSHLKRLGKEEGFRLVEIKPVDDWHASHIIRWQKVSPLTYHLLHKIMRFEPEDKDTTGIGSSVTQTAHLRQRF